MQGGFTKFCCFLCLWDSRGVQQHYIQREWPPRTGYIAGKHSVNLNLWCRLKKFFPPLHIKLGVMKNFVKALDKEEKLSSIYALSSLKSVMQSSKKAFLLGLKYEKYFMMQNLCQLFKLRNSGPGKLLHRSVITLWQP